MRNTKRDLQLVVGLLLAGLSFPLLADDFPCPPNRGAQTIDGNVLVTGICTLEGTRIIGNIHVYSGGALIAREVRVDGNIQAENAHSVDLASSRVDGDIQLDNLLGDRSIVANTHVGGNIQMKSNLSALEVARNRVGGDIQAFSNTGGVDITGNDVDGNLQCKENVTAPTGSANQVSGNSEDQCANLQPRSGDDTGSVPPPPSNGGIVDGDAYCPSNIIGKTVDGNVYVIGACEIEDSRIIGNVLMYPGGSAVIRSTDIDGNIQADNASSVDVVGGRVDGSIQIDDMMADTSWIETVRVGGNIQLKQNRVAMMVGENRVIGDVQAFENTGGVDITGNTIGGNLQCKSNFPAPTGGDNTVDGNKEDQCANLMPADPATSVTLGTGGTVGITRTATGADGTGDTVGGGGAMGPGALFALFASVLAYRRRAGASIGV